MCSLLVRAFGCLSNDVRDKRGVCGSGIRFDTGGDQCFDKFHAVSHAFLLWQVKCFFCNFDPSLNSIVSLRSLERAMIAQEALITLFTISLNTTAVQVTSLPST